MRALWICNTVLPEYMDMFGFKLPDMSGWMTGMIHEAQLVDDLEIGLCFPIYDEWRRKDGIKNGHKIYAFDGTMDRRSVCEKDKLEFIRIFDDFKPDLIHIWGTEYNHASAAVKASIDAGLISKTLVDLQGLTSYIPQHILNGIPEGVVDEIYKEGRSIRDFLEYYKKQGDNEIEVLHNASVVTGRTEWDMACSLQINPGLKYFKNHRILRDSFYTSASWEAENCVKHRVFLSNASYPLKGLHNFIPAIQLLKQQFKDISVHIAGGNILEADSKGEITQYGRYLKKLIEKYDVSDVIEFVGILSEEEMINEFREANVFAATSSIENSCNSLCEAQYLGVPSIGTYVGGIPDLIKHGVSGFLYPLDEPYMAAYHIGKIFGDIDLQRSISAASMKEARERHNKSKIIGINKEIYRSIVTRR